MFVFIIFPPRRQFCRERFPPERGGGVWEIRRSGPQAEERAGMNLLDFRYYFPFISHSNLHNFIVIACSVWSQTEFKFLVKQPLQKIKERTRV